jgi:hypothetical protein
MANQDNPSLFTVDGELFRLRKGENDYRSEKVDSSMLLGHLAKSANWVKIGKGRVTKVSPSNDVRSYILAEPALPFPPLKGISNVPVFSRNGLIKTTFGYDPETNYWLNIENAAITVPANPSKEEVLSSVSLFRDHLLVDFPFQDEASFANLLSAFLVPLVRPMIDGPTPLHLIDAAGAGTGKSLITSLIGIVALNKNVTVLTEAFNEEEWRKRITAVLLSMPTIISLDNLSKTLDSPALSGVVTATNWQDRILGQSKTINLPVNVLWLANGNNITVSNEISRRTVWIRLVSAMESPWTRKEADFVHPNLLAWAKEYRLLLIQALLTIVQAWIVAGQPAGQATLGSFESWAKVIGGILENACIQGFLNNADQFYAKADEDLALWQEFVDAWIDEHSSADVGVKQLYELAKEKELLSELFEGKSQAVHSSTLGKALTTRIDRNIGGYFIRSYRKHRSGSKLYRLEPAAS